MATSTLLCIHHDPAELSFLQDNGYELVTAASGSEGLRLFMARPVDAIVLEYHLGLLDGAAVADLIKQLRPEVPIVMLTEDLEFPDGALKSVDAVVTKTDGAHFLWATVHFVLNAKSSGPRETQRALPTNAFLRLTGRSWKGKAHKNETTADKHAERAEPFSPREWRSIRNGTLRF
jgi:DNA-binding response OmpR family regulator